MIAASRPSKRSKYRGAAARESKMRDSAREDGTESRRQLTGRADVGGDKDMERADEIAGTVAGNSSARDAL